MPAPGQWAVDNHPKRAEILAAMAAGTRNIDIHRNIAPDISRHGIGNYSRKVFRPAATIALQLAENKALSEITSSSTNVEKRATAQVSAAAPILARLSRQQARRDKWTAAAETDGKGPSGLDHGALIGYDRNELADARLLSELTGALTKETAGPVTNITIVGSSPAVEASPEVIDVEVVDAGE